MREERPSSPLENHRKKKGCVCVGVRIAWRVHRVRGSTAAAAAAADYSIGTARAAAAAQRAMAEGTTDEPELIMVEQSVVGKLQVSIR